MKRWSSQETSFVSKCNTQNPMQPDCWVDRLLLPLHLLLLPCFVRTVGEDAMCGRRGVAASFLRSGKLRNKLQFRGLVGLVGPSEDGSGLGKG